MTAPKIAIAHDYLTQRGGAERVVLSMLKTFPQATIYTTLYDPEGTFPEFRDARIVTSDLNRIGFFRKHHRAALPLLPRAASSLRIDADVTIVSSSGWAHGFDIRGRRVVYCHTPARWLHTDADDYLGTPAHRSLRGLALMALRRPLLNWDARAAAMADHYFANSRVVRERIKHAYGIDAELLAPPHVVSTQGPAEQVPDLADWADAPFHLLVSRLMPYKNVDKAIAAFSGLQQRLVIVGHGPLEQQLRASLPPNVRIVSRIPDDQIRWLYANASALIAPSHEDFGLTPIEAAAFGVPTVALRAGGYLDTVDEGRTGLFFDAAEPGQIADAVRRSVDRTWSADEIRRHASLFDEERFADRLRECVTEATIPDRFWAGRRPRTSAPAPSAATGSGTGQRAASCR